MRRVFWLAGVLFVRVVFLASMVSFGAGVLLLHNDTELRRHARDVYVALAIAGAAGLSLTGSASGGD